MSYSIQTKLIEFLKCCRRLSEADQALLMSIDRFSKQETAQNLNYQKACAGEIELNASTCSALIDGLLPLATELNLEWSHLRNQLLSSSSSLVTTPSPEELVEKFTKIWEENLPQIREILKLPESQTQIPNQPPEELLRSIRTVQSLNQMPESIISDKWMETVQARSKQMKDLARTASAVNATPLMQCPKCSSPIKEKQKFCKNCGTPIPATLTQPFPPPPTQNQFQPQPQFTPRPPQNASARPTLESHTASDSKVKGRWCSQCGAPLNPRDRFCKTCGAPQAQGGSRN